MTVSIAAVQQQRGGNDCGLFAIAFAFDIAVGVDPQYVRYVQPDMRKHLVACFKKGEITAFPRHFGGAKGIRKCKSSVTSFLVYCVCRQPESFGQRMVQCNHCQQWFHCECMNLKRPGRQFYCPTCSCECN